MGNYFNEVVDRAIEDLYYCCDNDKAKAAADADSFVQPFPGDLPDT